MSQFLRACLQRGSPFLPRLTLAQAPHTAPRPSGQRSHKRYSHATVAESCADSGLADAIDAESTMSNSSESSRSDKMGLGTAANRGFRPARVVRRRAAICAGLADQRVVRHRRARRLPLYAGEAVRLDAPNSFAIAVAGRGFEARISTESDRPLPDSACVYCGNCIGVCPTGALMFKSEYDMRQAGTWDESTQKVTETICPYCGVGCTLQLRVQENRIVGVTSPLDHDVTSGHLCIKGRFGWQFVQNRW